MIQKEILKTRRIEKFSKNKEFERKLYRILDRIIPVTPLPQISSLNLVHSHLSSKPKPWYERNESGGLGNW